MRNMFIHSDIYIFEMMNLSCCNIHCLLHDFEILYLAICNFRSDMRMQYAFFLKSGRPLKDEFRFRKTDIPHLAEALGIPEKFTCSQGTTTDGIEGLCVVLKRLSYTCRYSDLIPRFGQPVPVLSMINNTVLDYIYNAHSHRITQWNHSIVDPVNLERYLKT